MLNTAINTKGHTPYPIPTAVETGLLRSILGGRFISGLKLQRTNKESSRGALRCHCLNDDWCDEGSQALIRASVEYKANAYHTVEIPHPEKQRFGMTQSGAFGGKGNSPAFKEGQLFCPYSIQDQASSYPAYNIQLPITKFHENY